MGQRSTGADLERNQARRESGGSSQKRISTAIILLAIGYDVVLILNIHKPPTRKAEPRLQAPSAMASRKEPAMLSQPTPTAHDRLRDFFSLLCRPKVGGQLPIVC